MKKQKLKWLGNFTDEDTAKVFMRVATFYPEYKNKQIGEPQSPPKKEIPVDQLKEFKLVGLYGVIE
jgi:hypothetical protein